MTFEPARQADRPEGPEAEDRWGLKRAENLITSLQGILSARIVADGGGGDITEVHVFTNGSTSAKQVVRNVETALLAQLGLKVDHRKISVAQTADISPIEVLEKEAVRSRALKRGVVFQNLSVNASDRARVSFELTLLIDGEEVVTVLESADTPKARTQCAARVVVTALDKLLPRGAMDLEGVTIVDTFGTQFAFVGISILDGRNTRLVTGTCEVKEGLEQAAALAAMDATNRWTQSLL